MFAAFNAFEDFEGAVVAKVDLIDTLELVGDAEALTNDLKRDSGAASG